MKALKKLDKNTAKRILDFIRDRVLASGNPRNFGKALQGRLAEYWRYRVGDYRVVCQLIDEKMVVLVLRIGHRREVYRDKL